MAFEYTITIKFLSKIHLDDNIQDLIEHKYFTGLGNYPLSEYFPISNLQVTHSKKEAH